MTRAAAGPVGADAVIPPDWSFADRVRKIRREVVRMDQAAFAAKLGVTKQAYSAWESGRNEPRNLVAIARRIELISGVPAAWLLDVEVTKPVTHVSSARVHPHVIPFPQARRAGEHLKSAVPRPVASLLGTSAGSSRRAA